jgi:hypothetical protein
MRIAPPILAVLAFVLAGCVGSPEATQTEPVATENSELPDFKPLAPEEEAPRTILEAPKWKQGEWWKVRMSDVGFTGNSYEATRVVVGQEGDHYLVGMPRDAFSHDFMVLHIPGFGQVGKEDLSFEIHDALFQPIHFPIVEGDTWVTAFEGRPVQMTVREIESTTRAHIEMKSKAGQAGDNANLTYDALIGEVVLNEQPGYASYEVIEHGYDYEGIVTVPHMHDVIFQHFRIGAPVVNGLPAVTPSNVDKVQVDTTYDRVSAGLIYFSLTGGAAGYFSEKATAPSGEIFELTILPTDQSGVRILTFSSNTPGGSWSFEHVAGGAGIIGAEGIAYHTYDVDMPSGRILPSTGEHDHGG